jgi:hypothetical protein
MDRAAEAALQACRAALAEYQMGVLDDHGLRKALLDAVADIDALGVQIDRVVRSAVALPLFTDDALSQLRRSIDRLSSVPTRGRNP